MQILNSAVQTQQGMQLMNEAANGLNKISFPKAVTTDDDQYSNMNLNQLEALNDLDNIKQTIVPEKPLPAYVYTDDLGNQKLSDTGDVQSKTASTISLVFSNKDLTSDYYIKAIGIYAHDEGRNVDILYSIITTPEPRLQPAFDGNTPTSFKVKAITAVGRTSSLKVIVNDFDNVSEAEFQGAIADMAKKSYVDNQLNGKADKNDLQSKADKSDLNALQVDINNNLNSDSSPINQRIAKVEGDYKSYTDNSTNQLYNQITNDMKSKSNLPHIYNSIDEMNSDSSIQVGDLCFVLGDDI